MEDGQVDVTGRPTRLRSVDLDTFFRPPDRCGDRGVGQPERPNAAMWRKIRSWGDQFGAEVHPVNPTGTRSTAPSPASVLDLPGDLDLAVILVGDSVEAFEEVLEYKPAFAVIFAAGFAEVGHEGARLQERLEALVADGDTHLSARTPTSTRSRRSATTSHPRSR